MWHITLDDWELRSRIWAPTERYTSAARVLETRPWEALCVGFCIILCAFRRIPCSLEYLLLAHLIHIDGGILGALRSDRE